MEGLWAIWRPPRHGYIPGAELLGLCFSGPCGRAMCAGRGKETDWVTGHFCTRLAGLGPIVNLVELLNPLPRWPRAYFTCIVFVFIYPSTVLFLFFSLQRLPHVSLRLIFSKDLSGGRHKYSALKIHTNQTISLCRLHILVSNRWNELTRQSLHTLSSLENLKIVSFMIHIVFYKDTLSRWVFLSSVPCLLKKKKAEKKHFHKIVFSVVLSVVQFLGPIKAVCLSNKRWNQHRTG